MSDTLIPNIIQFISMIDPFDKLPKDDIKKLAAEIKITYVGKGQVVHHCHNENEKFLCIVRTGAIEQRKLDGVLRARLGPEDLFGFSMLGDAGANEDEYTATALVNSLLYLIPHGAIFELFEKKPQYAEHFALQAQVRLKTALDVVWSDKEKSLFIKKVSDVASHKVAVVQSDMTIQQVASEMRMTKRSSCALVCEGQELVGIVTDRDMTKRVVSTGISVDRPVTEIMTLSPLTIDPDDLVLTAASLMMEHNIRNLPVVKNGDIKGLLTTSHLVQNHRMQAIFLIEKIKYAESVDELSELTSERQAIFEALVEGKVASETVGKVMTMIMDSYTKRLIQIGISKFGQPPCEFSWIVAGSHARKEIHMLSDQDSAIVYSDDAKQGDNTYFQHLAMYVCNGLDKCGYPLCTGKYMAATPKWCQPLSIWKAYYKKWVANPEYERLLNISVFLEVRSVYGKKEYCSYLNDELHANIEKSREFLGVLVRESNKVNPPLGIFNNLVLEKNGDNANTLNIKKFALNVIIDLARIYALSVKCDLTGTEERFKYANVNGALSDDFYKNIIEAYRLISQIRFGHQLIQLKQGKEPNSNINPECFGSFERKHLKDAFRIISSLQEAAKVRFGI